MVQPSLIHTGDIEESQGNKKTPKTRERIVLIRFVLLETFGKTGVRSSGACVEQERLSPSETMQYSGLSLLNAVTMLKTAIEVKSGPHVAREEIARTKLRIVE